MRISGIKLHSIAIADPPLRSSYGLHAPWALRTIIELGTDDGLTGVAETYGGDGARAALEASPDQIVGRDPFQLASLYQRVCRNPISIGETVPCGHTQTWLVPG